MLSILITTMQERFIIFLLLVLYYLLLKSNLTYNLLSVSLLSLGESLHCSFKGYQAYSLLSQEYNQF